MYLFARMVILLVFALLTHSLLASDACLDRGIKTAASVEVSDGSRFNTESFFLSSEFSAIRHIDEEDQLIAVEGPLAWMQRGDKSQLGGDGLKRFALGHQFHALLIYFDEMVTDISSRNTVSFMGGKHQGRGGAYPHGGEVILIQDAQDARPLGLVLTLPDAPRMEMAFRDWRDYEGRPLPLQIRIDDGSRVFDYSYTRLEVFRATPTWFFEAVEAPDIDELKMYRLHRMLMAAHCIGDADLIASLSAAEITSSGQGVLKRFSRDSMRTRFSGVFEQVNYLHYEDIASPVIEVSDAGDIGWIAVNIRTRGIVIGGDQSFDDQWSWFMLTRKVDGKWLNAGIASNFLPDPD